MRLKAIHPRPRSKKEISNAVHQLYSEMDDDIRKKILDTFKDKLKECIRVHGHSIHNWKKSNRIRGNYHTDFDDAYSDDVEYHD